MKEPKVRYFCRSGLRAETELRNLCVLRPDENDRGADENDRGEI